MSGLTKKQLKVMDEIFLGEEDEDVVLVNNSVSRRVFDNWITEDAWIREFDRRIEKSHRRAQVIISRFQAEAAIKLVELTNCDKEQTARQACLDIIQMPRIIKETKIATSVESLELSEQTQETIIELLAKDARKARKKKSDIDKKGS